MSEHNKGAAGTSSNISAGDSKDQKQQYETRPSHMRLWMGGGILVLILGASTILVGNHFLHSSKTPQATKNTPGKLAAQQQSIDDQVLSLSLGGQYSAAQKLLDGQIAKNTSKSTQGELYEQKSNVAFSSGDYRASLQYAQQAESLHPTANSANWIGMSAEQLGNTQLALQYYQVELQRLANPIPPSANDSLKAKIAALQKGISQ